MSTTKIYINPRKYSDMSAFGAMELKHFQTSQHHLANTQCQTTRKSYRSATLLWDSMLHRISTNAI